MQCAKIQASTKVDSDDTEKKKEGENVVKNRLKELRAEREISQEELSEMCGISRATLSKIENNEEVNVNTRTIAKIAEAFGVRPSDIFLM